MNSSDESSQSTKWSAPLNVRFSGNGRGMSTDENQIPSRSRRSRRGKEATNDINACEEQKAPRIVKDRKVLKMCPKTSGGDILSIVC